MWWVGRVWWVSGVGVWVGWIGRWGGCVVKWGRQAGGWCGYSVYGVGGVGWVLGM